VAPSAPARPGERLRRAPLRGGAPPVHEDPFIEPAEVGDLLPVSVAPHRGDVVAALVGGRVQHEHIHIENSGWSKP
jgi:hypothetical protein